MRSPLLVAMMASPRASHLIVDVVLAAVQDVVNTAVAAKDSVKICLIIVLFNASMDAGMNCSLLPLT